MTFKDFNEDGNGPIKPTPLNPTGLVPMAQNTRSIAEDMALIEELVSLEHEVWDLRDSNNSLLELQPFGQLNVKFELAFLHPELVSRQYPVSLT